MTIVIAGGGMSAGNAAVALRDEGYEGSIVILGAEPTPPFGRPPLSKGYLRGEEDVTGWYVRPPEWYSAHDVELRLDAPVAALDPGRHVVLIRGGEELAYDRLLIATGVRNRRLPIPGADLDGVMSLRTQADCDRIRTAVGRGDRVVMVGIGFIGSEVAASLTQIGARVTSLFPESAPLARVLGDDVAGVLGSIHREHGVELLAGEGVEAFEGQGRVAAVRTRSGARLECSAVIVAVGVTPNIEFLEGSGVAIENGVLVDQHCRTNVPDVFACGDVANMDHPLFGRVRVEHYNNAEKHGAAAGRALLGTGEPYGYNFSFWSDQYDQSLEYVGMAHTWDRFIARGDLEERRFVGFYLSAGVLRAAVALGRGGDPEADPDSELAACAELIAAGAAVNADALADEDIDLRDRRITQD